MPGLAFAGNTFPANCHAGQTHDYTGSGDYALSFNDAVFPGQEGWKWCNKCQGLCFTGTSDPGPVPPAIKGSCPGGVHDHTRSVDHTLVINNSGIYYTFESSVSYLYNMPVYTNASVPNGNYTFVIHSPRSSIDSVVLFDYVQYT
jgi:hypothetical protein